MTSFSGTRRSRARAAADWGPSAPRRAFSTSVRAASRSHCTWAYSAGTRTRVSVTASGNRARISGSRSTATQRRRPPAVKTVARPAARSSAKRRGQAPSLASASASWRKPRVRSASCSSSALSASGHVSRRTRSMASGSSRPRSAAEAGSSQRRLDHRAGASLLERRIVQEGIGLGVQDLLGERRGLGQITGDDPRLAARDLPEQAFQPLDIHGLAEAVAQGLLDQGVVRDLAPAGHVLETGGLIREHRGQEVVGQDALELRPDLVCAASGAVRPARRWRSSASGS